MCRQNPFFISNLSWTAFNFVQVCQCKLMKYTTKWPNTPVISASKKTRLCKQLMQSSNGSTLLLTHSGVPCSVLKPSSRLAFGSCWLSRGEKQWLNYWTNQGPRLCIYMILVMRPLEIRLSVVERNKIFINAEVCVCGSVYVFDLQNLYTEDDFTDRTLLDLLSSLRSCSLISALTDSNSTAVSGGAPPERRSQRRSCPELEQPPHFQLDQDVLWSRHLVGFIIGQVVLLYDLAEGMLLWNPLKSPQSISVYTAVTFKSVSLHFVLTGNNNGWLPCSFGLPSLCKHTKTKTHSRISYT